MRDEQQDLSDGEARKRGLCHGTDRYRPTVQARKEPLEKQADSAGPVPRQGMGTSAFPLLLLELDVRGCVPGAHPDGPTV